MTQEQPFSVYFGDWQLPMDMTSLSVSSEGEVTATAQKEFSFQFRYRGIGFTVRFKGDDQDSAAKISANLGRLPFSVESAAQRQALLAIALSVNAHLGPIISMPNGKMMLAKTLPTGTPVTAVGLITELTQFLLTLKPYLDLASMVRMMS